MQSRSDTIRSRRWKEKRRDLLWFIYPKRTYPCTGRPSWSCVVNAQILALGGPTLKPWYCMSPKSVIIPECGLYYITNGVRVGTNRPYHVISRCFGVSWQACGTRWHRKKLRDFPSMDAIKSASTLFPGATADSWLSQSNVTAEKHVSPNGSTTR